MQIPDYISASYIKNCYKNTSLSKSKSSKKLASGYRINTAADDAAKLSISEKMRAQIRGLDQASNNIQDSISFLQVADGALETASTIMQRIRELSVQAANDTYTDQDRAQMQQECDQLQEEMLSTFGRAVFHSKQIFTDLDSLTPKEISKLLLDGKFPIFDTEQPVDGKDVQSEVLNMISHSLRILPIAEDVLGKLLKTSKLQIDHSEKAQLLTYGLEVLQYAKGLESYSYITNYQDCIIQAENLVKQAIQREQVGCDSKSIVDTAKNSLLEILYEGGNTYTYLPSCYIQAFNNFCAIAYDLDEHKINHAKNLITLVLPRLYEKLKTTAKVNLTGSSLLQSLIDNHYDSAFKTLASLSGMCEISLSLQNGANTKQGLQLQIAILNIPKTPFDLSSYRPAKASIDKADRFLTQLTAARSEIGAYQNRLESALSYTEQGAEALQDTESRMRDANMAKEAADYAKTKLQNEFQLSFLAQKNASKTDVSVLSFSEEKKRN